MRIAQAEDFNYVGTVTTRTTTAPSALNQTAKPAIAAVLLPPKEEHIGVV